jgi:hypothetical protein
MNSDQQLRTDFRIRFVAETEKFLSEISGTRGKVAVATLTRSEGLAAKNNRFMAEGDFK